LRVQTSEIRLVGHGSLWLAWSLSIRCILQNRLACPRRGGVDDGAARTVLHQWLGEMVETENTKRLALPATHEKAPSWRCHEGAGSGGRPGNQLSLASRRKPLPRMQCATMSSCSFSGILFRPIWKRQADNSV